MRSRPPPAAFAGPFGAALALHAVLALVLAAAPPRRLAPAPEPVAISLVAMPVPAPTAAAPPPGAADLQEAMPAPVAWPVPEAAAPPQAPAPHRGAAPPRRAAAPQAPPVPSSGSTAEPAHPPASPGEIAAWQEALSAWVERHRRYPPAARFRQEEGTVRIRFELDAAGMVRTVALESSSGSGTLDAAAVTLLTGAALPKPPTGMEPGRRTVSLSIRYRLE